jgi:ubiquinone/menaquinone biosynthesis C-methylase UbiE
LRYFSLARRVAETSAVEPKALTRLYSLISQVPLVRATHRRFIASALSQGMMQGWCLDLGTGPGYVAVEVARQRPGLKMAGLDLAAHMVELAAQRETGAGQNGLGLWLQGDGHHLPFGNGTLDLVISSFALHHWDDPLRVLNEISRVLAPNGRYYIADVCRTVNAFQRAFAYASIPIVSLLFGSYRGYGGFYESVRAGYTCDEAQVLLDQSVLPRGQVRLESSWFVPILTITTVEKD